MRNERMYIAFYKGYSGSKWNKFKQWFVKAYTFGKYGHCEIVHLQDDEVLMWYGATTYNPDGVAARVIPYNPEKWDVFDITEHVNFKVTLKILRSKIGLKYDWLGIYFSQGLPFHAHNEEEYFCSEYLAEALKMDHPHKYSPNSLIRRMKMTCFIPEKPLTNLNWTKTS